MAQSSKNPATRTTLSQVPLYAQEDITLPDGKKLNAGQTEWIERSVAQQCEERQLGTILAAVSVRSPVPNWKCGGSIGAYSDLFGYPWQQALQLEQEGRLKIMRSDDDVAAHKAAWGALGEKQKELIRRARQMHADADALIKQSNALRSPWSGAGAEALAAKDADATGTKPARSRTAA